MDIKSVFLSSLVSLPRLSQGQRPEDFLGSFPPGKEWESPPLPSLLSCADIKAAPPWSFDIRSMDCYLLLYTRKGFGKLTVNNQVFSLVESSLLLLDCHQRFRFDIAVSVWEYQMILFNGKTLSYYFQFLPNRKIPIVQIPPYSDIAMDIKFLTDKAHDCPPRQRLIISDLLSHIVTICINETLSADSPAPEIPSHIKSLKSLFDDHFNDFYTLDALASQLKVNKYRLCREFSNIYGLPPLQYLNKKRIEYAAHLLLTTSYKIHEVGSMAGIDNTNHFISLFKKFYNVTPLEYRKRMTL